MGEAFQQQQAGGVGHLQDGCRMRFGGNGFDGQAGVAETLAGDVLDEGEDVVALEVVVEDVAADVGGEVGHVEAQRQVAEVAQPLDEDDLFAGLQPELGGHRRRGGDRHRGADLVADLAVPLEGLL
ncbi:hypothetical protein BEL07_01290 [Mycolicibacterium grossiae]|uniref:Uncharacterized protein n=1 Tax=Mycolicibacterium grossiae TaxID=1552759 RepID=A0A1E8QC90_9MYCO|nr:hypothetical protein BEL07_01290 [Mycolicibacterium grossiae]